jgi:hypothetical protein
MRSAPESTDAAYSRKQHPRERGGDITNVMCQSFLALCLLAASKDSRTTDPKLLQAHLNGMLDACGEQALKHQSERTHRNGLGILGAVV